MQNLNVQLGHSDGVVVGIGDVQDTLEMKTRKVKYCRNVALVEALPYHDGHPVQRTRTGSPSKRLLVARDHL
jgi:hypothetical protein